MDESDMLDHTERAIRSDPARAQARQHIEKMQNLGSAVIACVVVNTACVALWAATGGGYFWPGWVMAAWGVGLILGLWDYDRRLISDADVDAELRRHAPSRPRSGNGSLGKEG